MDGGARFSVDGVAAGLPASAELGPTLFRFECRGDGGVMFLLDFDEDGVVTASMGVKLGGVRS